MSTAIDHRPAVVSTLQSVERGGFQKRLQGLLCHALNEQGDAVSDGRRDGCGEEHLRVRQVGNVHGDLIREEPHSIPRCMSPLRQIYEGRGMSLKRFLAIFCAVLTASPEPVLVLGLLLYVAVL